MTNQMVTFNGINALQRRTIATTTKRKQAQLEALEALETAQTDYYAPLTVADVLWSIAIYGGFIIALVFTGIMIGGVL